MAVPKRRTSHARQGKRRSHLHLKPMQIQYCARCEQPVQAHRVCTNCGYYSTQAREVVNMEATEEEKKK
jgi:large subunit ribosomal protein L32